MRRLFNASWLLSATALLAVQGTASAKPTGQVAPATWASASPATTRSLAAPATAPAARSTGRVGRATAIRAAVATPLPFGQLRREAQGGCFLRKVGRFFRRVGRSIKRGFQRFGRRIKRAFRRIGRGIRRAFRRVGRFFRRVGRAIKRAFRRRRKAKPPPPPPPLTETYSDSYVAPARLIKLNRKVWTTLEKYDKRLKGETFHDVTKRLVSFFRKAGAVRNFTRAMRESGNDVQKIADPKNLPERAKKEMAHHGSAKTVKTRNRREMLRRKVDQWTYGYEYEQIGGFLKGAGKGRNARMLQDYRQVEAEILGDFWSDCSEVHAICQLPKTKREKEACVACAEEIVRRRCLGGRDPDTKQCKGSHSVSFLTGRRKVNLKTGRGGYTFFGWLSLEIIQEAHNDEFHRGNAVTRMNDFQESVIQNLVDRRFLPKETGKGKSTDGKQYLDSLPVTAWQRCVLFNPYERPRGQLPRICDNQTGKLDMKDLQAKKKGNVPWERARLFKMVLADTTVQKWLKKRNEFWKRECRKTKIKKKKFLFITISKKRVRKWDCVKEAKRGRSAADKFFGRGGADKLGMSSNKRLKKAGKAISGAIGPIIGKLLGMLLKAAGLYETMKTLARAAGMTPEQGADCEDAEYRREVMKLPPKQDNKRGCLLRVFAKNFTSVLESIIIMLGNKLVDWGVDLLRTALQGVKSALISAAGSVPFAGGFLAALVDIGWELIMNFGAKMLLKGFVVAKLPTWLQVHKLAKLPWKKVLDNPIVQVVAGIILQLIDSAMTYGDKSWMAVGIDSVINTVQVLLQDTKQWFWIRALTYAKKEMRASNPGDSLMDQLLHVGRAMIGGFGAAISRRLDAESRDVFDKAVDDIKALLTKTKIEQFKGKLLANPVKALTELIGKKIGPVVMPVVTSLVPMPDWAKQMLNRVGTGLSATLTEISEKRFDAKKLVGRIVGVLEPVAVSFLEKLPIADRALKDMLVRGFQGIAGALKNIDQIEAQYLRKPWRIVEAVVGLAGDFLKAKVGDLIKDPKLAPEKKLLQDAVGTILAVLGDQKVRDSLFAGGRPNLKAILAKLAQVVKPYAKARLGALAAKIGLQEVVEDAVEFLFGPQGPLVAGQTFFRNLPNLLRQKGQAAMAALAKVASGLLEKAMQSSVGGGVLASMVKGILGMIGNAMKSPAGLAGMFKDTNSILKSVTDLIGGFLRKAPDLIADARLAPEKKLLASAVDVILKTLADPNQRRQLFSSAQAIFSKVAALAKPYLSERLGALGKSLGMEGPIKAAVDFLLGPRGPLLASQTFFRNLPNLLRQKGQQAMAEVTRIASGLVQKAMGSLGSGPLGSLVKGIMDSLAGAMKSRGGLASVFRAPQNILKAAKDALKPLLDSLLGKLAANVQASPIQSLLRNVLGGVMSLFDNPQQLVQQGIQALKALAQKVAAGLKGMLTSLIARAIPDAGLRGLIGKAVDGFFNLVSDPTKITRFTGAKILDLLTGAGKELFGYLKDKALAFLRSAQLSKLGAAAQGVLTGLLNSVQQLIGNPGQLKALVEGGVKGLVAAAGRAIGPAISAVVQNAVPAALKQVAKQVVDKVTAFFSNPAELGNLARTTVQGLLAKAAPMIQGLLQGILKSVVPPNLVAKVTAAVGKIRAALANPAALLQQAGQAARKAIDDTLASLILQIGDPTLRDVAANLVSLVRDLVTSGSVGNKLRTDIKALLERLVDVGARYLTNLLPRGPAQTIVGEVLDGLKTLVTNPGGLGQALAQKASALLPRLQGVLQRLLGDLVQRFLPDPTLASVVSGLAGEVLGLIANPSRYRELLQKGLGFLLSRAVPIVRDLVMAAVGRVSSLGEQARGVISGLFDSITRLFANPSAIANFARNAVSSLVSMGVGAVVPLVTNLVQKVGSPALTDFTKRALNGVADLIRDPAKLKAFFKQPPTKIIGTLLGEAKTLLTNVAGTLIHDPALKRVAQQGLGAVLDFVTGAVAGGANLGNAVKQSIAKVIPAVAGLVKDKLLAIFPGHLDAVRQVVAQGFDGLVSLGSGLLARGKAAWDAFVAGGPAAIFGRLLKGVLPMVTGPVLRAIPVPALRTAVSQVLASLTGLIGGTGGKSGAQITRMFLGQAKTLLASLAGSYIKDPTIKQVAQEGLKLVVDFVEKAMAGGGNVAAAVKSSLAKMIPVVAKLLRDKLLGLFPYDLGGLKSVVSSAFDELVNFGSQLIANPQRTWQRFTAGGGGALFGKLLGSVIPLVKEPVVRAVGYPPLKGLLSRLLDVIGELLSDPGKLIGEFRKGAQAAMALLLPKLDKVLGPFAYDVIVKPMPKGIPRDVVGALVDAGRSFLAKPGSLQDFIRTAKTNAKGLIKKIINGLAPALLRSVPSQALQAIFKTGIDMMVNQFLKGT